jgi:hypothetical protein
MAKEKKQIIASPSGIAKFPALNEPDMKFAKDGVGKYKVNLLLDKNDPTTVAFLEKLIAASKDAKSANDKENPKQKGFSLHLPFADELDKDGNETGNVEIKFSANSSFKNKKTDKVTDIRIDLFDAKRNRVTAKIGGGSKLKVAFEIVPFANPSSKSAGVSLRLQAVQVLELKQWSGRDADSYGFGEEDGFDGAADSAFSADEPTSETADPVSGGGDF